MKRYLFFLLLITPLFTLKAYANQDMVVTEQHLATKIGAQVLAAGGNAIDAAVAVGYALAVVHPCCGNLGGGGFITLHLANGKNSFINFRERAPLAAKSTMYLDSQGRVLPEKSTHGYLAVATPGTVLGLETALKKYGTLPRKKLIAPAIELAEKGYILRDGDVKLLHEHTEDFKKQSNVAAIFLKNNQPLHVGDRLIQKDLANTLREISAEGAAAFYKGKIAEKIVAASIAHQGILSKKDFTSYYVEEFQPITCHYRDYTIISAPPPSSGGIAICEMLAILEGYPLPEMGFHSPEAVHYMVEAMRFAFYDRNNKIGDPNFVKNDWQELISKKYAAKIRQLIKEKRATPSAELATKPFAKEGVNTTHYSVIDKWGNAVSVTITLNSFFGANVIAGNTGFFLNNEMDDFTAKPGVPNQFGLVEGHKNSIQPGKRPLSSMAPTIVTKNNKVLLIIGSPGGPRIITAILETLVNVLDFCMGLQEAVNAPRFHHQWLPDVIELEPKALAPETRQKLMTMGYKIASINHWGAVETIYIGQISQKIYGANDYRRPAGAALGN